MPFPGNPSAIDGRANEKVTNLPKQMLAKSVAGQSNSPSAGESRLDRRAVNKVLPEKDDAGSASGFHSAAGRPALDQKVSRATAEIDLAERIIIGIDNRPPIRRERDIRWRTELEDWD